MGVIKGDTESLNPKPYTIEILRGDSGSLDYT